MDYGPWSVWHASCFTKEKIKMKRNIIIAAAAAAVGLAYYVVSNKKSKKSKKSNLQEYKPLNHMTDVFARAKEQAVK